MPTLQLTITQAGLDALVDAQAGQTDPIRITEIAISETQVAVAPTLEAIPNELKRIASFSGQSVSETIIHMTAQDSSADIYDLRTFGLFLENGTLFAAYSQAEPIFRKVDIAAFLISFDVAFGDAIGGDIEFGDATFLYPPATEAVKGVAEIATQPEVDAGLDDERIVTALKLATLLAPMLQSIVDEAAARAAAVAGLQGEIDAEEVARANADTALQALIDALEANTVTGAGLVTGGGALPTNPVLTVTEASGAEALAEALASVVVTPNTLAGFARSVGQNGYATIPGTGGLIIQHGRVTATGNAATSVTWPIAFPTACYAAVANGASTDAAVQDNDASFRSETISTTGASIYNNTATHQASYIAIGR